MTVLCYTCATLYYGCTVLWLHCIVFTVFTIWCGVVSAGDFDGAVDHYLAAESNLMDVFSLFPDLIPPTVASLIPTAGRERESSRL